MIKYNLKYRGPFEYDKLLLNVLQLSNEVKYALQAVSDGELNLLDENNTELKELHEQLTSENGLLSEFLKLKLKIKGGAL